MLPPDPEQLRLDQLPAVFIVACPRGEDTGETGSLAAFSRRVCLQNKVGQEFVALTCRATPYHASADKLSCSSMETATPVIQLAVPTVQFSRFGVSVRACGAWADTHRSRRGTARCSEQTLSQVTQPYYHCFGPSLGVASAL